MGLPLRCMRQTRTSKRSPNYKSGRGSGDSVILLAHSGHRDGEIPKSARVRSLTDTVDTKSAFHRY
jgi:hypothetical protein